MIRQSIDNLLVLIIQSKSGQTDFFHEKDLHFDFYHLKLHLKWQPQAEIVDGI